jgi:hypothetical protein
VVVLVIAIMGLGPLGSPLKAVYRIGDNFKHHQ